MTVVETKGRLESMVDEFDEGIRSAVLDYVDNTLTKFTLTQSSSKEWDDAAVVRLLDTLYKNVYEQANIPKLVETTAEKKDLNEQQQHVLEQYAKKAIPQYQEFDNLRRLLFRTDTAGRGKVIMKRIGRVVGTGIGATTGLLSFGSVTSVAVGSFVGFYGGEIIASYIESKTSIIKTAIESKEYEHLKDDLTQNLARPRKEAIGLLHEHANTTGSSHKSSYS